MSNTPHRNRKTSAYLILLFLPWLIACTKSDAPSERTGGTIPSEIYGEVLDQNGDAFILTDVSVRSTKIKTDGGYQFLFSDLQVNDREVIKFEQKGYFTGYRTIFTEPDQSSYLRLELASKPKPIMFNSAVGGTFNNFTIAPNSFVNKSTKTPYNGTVLWYEKYMAQTENPMMFSPGAFIGLDKNKQEVGLHLIRYSLIMATDLNGNELELADDKPATVSMMNKIIPLPHPTTSDSLHYWLFDPVSGYWNQQEGTVISTYSNAYRDYIYSGRVSKLAHTMLAISNPVIDFSCQVNYYSKPLQFGRLTMRRSDGLQLDLGSTNEKGFFRGKIYSNSSGVIEVSNRCNKILAVQSITTSTTPLSNFVITSAKPNPVARLSGYVVNCMNEPLDSGYLGVQDDGLLFSLSIPIIKGRYNQVFSYCNESIQKRFTYSNKNAAQSDASYMNLLQGENFPDTLMACSNSNAEYINYQINNGEVEFVKEDRRTPPITYYSKYFNITTVEYRPSDSWNRNMADINLIGEPKPGYHTLHSMFLREHDQMAFTSKPQVQVRRYEQPGGYVTGNFSGSVILTPGSAPVPIKVNFRGKRIY